MAVTQEFLNADSYFKSTTGDKIIINDLNVMDLTDKETINNSLMTVYNNTDAISTVPSCDCGVTYGAHRIGQDCPSCGSKCKDYDSKIEPLLWLKSLDNNYKFLNPDFWLMVSKLLDKKLDYLRWMCDYQYNPPTDLPNFMIGVKEVLGNVREYNNTMEKLGDVFKYLLTHARFKDKDKQETILLFLELWDNKRDELFSTYIPIINKKLFVMENTTKGAFVNLVVSDVLDLVMSWCKEANKDVTIGARTKDKKGIVTAVTLSKLASLYNKYFKDYVVQKIGIFRKHVYGSRSHFTFRTVIGSFPGKHEHNEIHIPWSVAVTAFRPHIFNKLFNKYNYNGIETSNILIKAVKKYIPVVHEIINELIAETKYMGIPCLAQRNPSLKQGSSQLVYITGLDIKPLENGSYDISSLVTRFSQLVAKSPNALGLWL